MLYFISFERDAKLKGLRHSTDRTPVNCASGKYHSSPFKLESPDTNLAKLVSSKVHAVEGLQDQYRQLTVKLTQRVRQDFPIIQLGYGNKWE